MHPSLQEIKLTVLAFQKCFGHVYAIFLTGLAAYIFQRKAEQRGLCLGVLSMSLARKERKKVATVEL